MRHGRGNSKTRIGCSALKVVGTEVSQVCLRLQFGTRLVLELMHSHHTSHIFPIEPPLDAPHGRLTNHGHHANALVLDLVEMRAAILGAGHVPVAYERLSADHAKADDLIVWLHSWGLVRVWTTTRSRPRRVSANSLTSDSLFMVGSHEMNPTSKDPCLLNPL